MNTSSSKFSFLRSRNLIKINGEVAGVLGHDDTATGLRTYAVREGSPAP